MGTRPTDPPSRAPLRRPLALPAPPGWQQRLAGQKRGYAAPDGAASGAEGVALARGGTDGAGQQLLALLWG